MNSKKIQVVSFQSLSSNSGAGMARLGFFLSKELHKRGILKNFIVYSKGKFNTPFPSVPVSFWSRYILFFLNAIHKYLPFPNHKFRLMQERIYDWFCTMRIKKDTKVLFTTNAFLRRTFVKAKKLGIVIILLPGTPEENYIYDLVTEENNKLGITAIDAYTYKKRLAYFNSSVVYIDKLVGSLPTVRSSYSQSKHFKGEIINMLGHMTPDFKPVPPANKKVHDGEYKVGYIAHTVVLKGLHYLLSSWKDIMNDPANGNMKLYIAGGIDDAMQKHINANYANLKNVFWLGHLSNTEEFFSSLDLFVVPSLIDGAPISALEAAHYSVPVIITDNSGSSELLSRNKGGCWVIPIRDTDAIKEKILWAFNNQAEAIETGKNAKYNLDNYSMEDFVSNIADYLEFKV
ncbi:MAG: glycosyltransferase family 4 protein [Bacteroidetes bacterium]|nr:glycosyltransferase family 4 protein [Bacteroidota bacterium]